MRIFEITTMLLLIATIGLRYTHKEKSIKVLENLTVLSLVGHFLVEKARWQMYGVYILVFILAITSYKELQDRIKGKKVFRIFGVFIVVLSFILICLFPIRHIEKPTGEYRVGTISMDVEDKERIEKYGERKGENRKIRLQFWYPTVEDAKGETEKWIVDGKIVPRMLMEVYKAPKISLDYITYIESNSIKEAPIHENIGKMPVVIISHGWTGFRNLHTDLAEMFASRGYLAISIDHSYGSVGLVYEDGETVKVDESALPNKEETKDFITYANTLVTTYEEDSKTVLDLLEEIEEGTVAENKIDGSAEERYILKTMKHCIDIEKIGIIGHSTGGGGAVQLATDDTRVKAVVGLDPWVEPIGKKTLQTTIEQPMLFFRSSAWKDGINDEYIKVIAKNTENTVDIYEIEGTKHQDFSMIYQLEPIPSLVGITGKTDVRYSAGIYQEFMLKFIEQEVNGRDTNIEKLEEKYPIVSRVNF